MSEESNLVRHAKHELELSGAYKEDPELCDSLVEAVRAFASYGHSGGSAGWSITALDLLLRFKTIAPLTSNPDEWMDVAEYSSAPGEAEGVWQSRRQADVFSYNGGQTWYSLDDPRWHQKLRGWRFRRAVRAGTI
jgi:hypothetical protein